MNSRKLNRMVVATTRATLLLLVALLFAAFSPAHAESCRFLTCDFPRVADSVREGALWKPEQVRAFLADSVFVPVKLQFDGGRIRSYSIDSLPEVVYLRRMDSGIAVDNLFFGTMWNRLLAALSALDCENIRTYGRPITADSALIFTAAARRAALRATAYDPRYVKIAREGGDVSPDRGVCSDVIIRGLRAIGIDLQVLVHEDMTAHFSRYRKNQPGDWSPDSNIDHRRVTNLMVYFKSDTTRFMAITPADSDWKPGDIVVWNLKNGHGFLGHIGVVSEAKGSSGNYEVIHHLPPSGSEDDRLHGWLIIGHYRLR